MQTDFKHAALCDLINAKRHGFLIRCSNDTIFIDMFICLDRCHAFVGTNALPLNMKEEVNKLIDWLDNEAWFYIENAKKYRSKG